MLLPKNQTAHVEPTARVHHIVKNGSEKAVNVVPERASVLLTHLDGLTASP
jgi:hypothetical protein